MIALEHVRFGGHQQELRQRYGLQEPLVWRADLQGARSHEWEPPTLTELAALLRKVLDS